MSMLHPQFFAPLRAMRTAALRHTVTVATEQTIRLPNGEYETGPGTTVVMQGLLTRPSLRAAEQAAAQGIQGDGVLKLPLGTVLQVGAVATVEGETAGEPWTRRVEVLGSLRGDKVNARFSVNDVPLDQPEG